jgi:hypothetical protein
MSGAPGIGSNSPEGFVPFSAPPQPRVIAVPHISGVVDVPLSVFPNWRTDGGLRGFGGARVISIFDATSTEGVSTPDIPAITDQSLEGQGTFQIANPDAQKLYRMIIRLRSSVGDPNYRDFPVAFRVVGPLEVPLEFAVWDDGEIPDIEIDSDGDFQWSFDAPGAEVRILDAHGGIQVGASSAAVFGAAPKAFLLQQFAQQRDGFIAVDFYADGSSSEATRRQYYHFWFDGDDWHFEKFRHRDFPDFDYYSGSTLGLAEVTVDRDGETAELTFTNNSHTYGQRFESFIVSGKKGYLSIDPKMVLTGGTVDISSVVDFGVPGQLSRLGHDDQYIVLYAATPEKIIIRNIPAFPAAQQTMTVDGGELVPDNVTMPAEMLFSRLVEWPWISFPNLGDFLDVPPGAVNQNPAGGKYPDLLEIELYDGTNPTPVAEWDDEVELWEDLVELQLPNQGLTIPVLDVRSLLTASSTHYRIRAKVRLATDPSDTAYKFEAHYPLNTDGEPTLFLRDDMEVTPYAVDMVFNQWGRLEITYLDTSGVATSDVEVRGDVGAEVVGTNPGAAQTDTFDIRHLISRQASYVDVKFTYEDGAVTRDIVYRVPTTAKRTQLAGTEDINPIISGNTVVFPTGSLSGVDGAVTFIGDVGSITIHDPQENQVYFTAQFGDGGERLLASPLRTYIDVEFESSSVVQRVRVPLSAWDLRATKDEVFSTASRGHGPTAGGLPSLSHDFRIPRVRVSVSTGEIDFEDDDTGLAWNFSQWGVFYLGNPLRKAIFTGTIVPGTPYNIANVLAAASVGEHVLLVFRHASGLQKVFTAEITNPVYQKAKRLADDGFPLGGLSSAEPGEPPPPPPPPEPDEGFYAASLTYGLPVIVVPGYELGGVEYDGEEES